MSPGVSTCVVSLSLHFQACPIPLDTLAFAPRRKHFAVAPPDPADSSFYTHLPPSPPANLLTRTFCILPPTTHPLWPHFTPQTNTLATDEVSAHMGMFNPRTNDGFYDLGLAVVRLLAERIEKEGVGKSGEATVGAMEGWREEKMGDKTVWVEE